MLFALDNVAGLRAALGTSSNSKRNVFVDWQRRLVRVKVLGRAPAAGGANRR